MSAPASPSAPPARRGIARRAVRRLGWLLAGIVVLAAAAPYLANIGPLRYFVLRAATPGLKGSISIGQASLGWFSPVRVGQIEVRPEEGPPVITIEAIEGNRSLAALLLRPRALGTFAIRRPQVHLVLYETGSNLSSLVQRPDEPPDPDRPRPTLAQSLARLPNVAWQLAVDEASLSVWQLDEPAPHDVGHLNLRLGVARDDGGACALEVAPGTVLDRLQITPGLCNSLLKYAAPTLARASQAAGTFSLRVDEWHLPLESPQAGRLRGAVELERIEVGPGPMIERIAALVGIPPSLVVVDDATVQFELIEGRIHHSPLELRLGALVLRTQGSVGFDDTLEMLAEVPLPVGLLPDGPLREALSGQSLRLPIRGTINQPVLDESMLGASAGKVLLTTLRELIQNKPGTVSDSTLEQRLAEQGLLAAGTLLDALLEARSQMGTPILDRWREGGGLRQWLRRPRGGASSSGGAAAGDADDRAPSGSTAQPDGGTSGDHDAGGAQTTGGGSTSGDRPPRRRLFPLRQPRQPSPGDAI